MAQKEMITNDKIGSATVVQHEDAVLKTAAQFFAKELLPYLGIDGKVISSAATQNVIKHTHIEIMRILTNTAYCFFVYAFE